MIKSLAAFKRYLNKYLSKGMFVDFRILWHSESGYLGQTRSIVTVTTTGFYSVPVGVLSKRYNKNLLAYAAQGSWIKYGLASCWNFGGNGEISLTDSDGVLLMKFSLLPLDGA